MNNNRFLGTIPSTLGLLTILTYLSAGGNQLTGELPPSPANLTQLVTLDICYNSFSGSILKE